MCAPCVIDVRKKRCVTERSYEVTAQLEEMFQDEKISAENHINMWRLAGWGGTGFLS